jgi:hypothetical protein
MFNYGHRLRVSSIKVPQNLGLGQKRCPDHNILGLGKTHGIEEMTRVKLAYRFDGSVVSNDLHKVQVQRPPKSGR